MYIFTKCMFFWGGWNAISLGSCPFQHPWDYCIPHYLPIHEGPIKINPSWIGKYTWLVGIRQSGNPIRFLQVKICKFCCSCVGFLNGLAQARQESMSSCDMSSGFFLGEKFYNRILISMSFDWWVGDNSEKKRNTYYNPQKQDIQTI